MITATALRRITAIRFYNLYKSEMKNEELGFNSLIFLTIVVEK